MKQKMTPQQAVQFEQTSETSAQILEAATRERGCNCQPYVDWFTFDRWIAQGKCVKKGEHGVRLMSFQKRIVDDKQKGDGSKKEITTPTRVYVFCRCQVKELNAPQAEQEPIPAEAPFVTEVNPNFAKRLALVEI
jgi:antirestriction protein ArdC